MYDVGGRVKLRIADVVWPLEIVRSEVRRRCVCVCVWVCVCVCQSVDPFAGKLIIMLVFPCFIDNRCTTQLQQMYTFFIRYYNITLKYSYTFRSARNHHQGIKQSNRTFTFVYSCRGEKEPDGYIVSIRWWSCINLMDLGIQYLGS
jgi:hypothetical protein